jgi:uncharacterized protein YukJ
MAGLNKYGVLVGRPISHKFGAGANGHYQVRVIDDTTDYRIAINVKSAVSPSELLYLIDDNFQHPLLAQLVTIPTGFHLVEKKPGGVALDFIRGNLFDRTKMKILAGDIAGPDNDLNEEINRHIQRAITDEDALIYAFGERWGPEPTTKDKYFGFLPGNGIHDIHMNQGNVGQFKGDDGVWQDGGLLIRNSNGQWTGIFMAFQSQAWHTDDVTGHTIPGLPPLPPLPPSPGTPTPTPPVTPPVPPTQPVTPQLDLVVRIVAALVNPSGADQGLESVTLINTSDAEIALDGWAIANKVKEKHTLSGKIGAGATKVVILPANVPLSNQGGIITLLDKAGLKVHGVQYTKQQADKQGWTLVF